MKKILFLAIALISSTIIFAQGNKTDSTAKAAYSCPMHPEVTATKPGKCPKCGMDLVKEKTYTCPMHPGVMMHKPGKCPKCGMDMVEKKKA